ncbi:MAG: VOC family protein [Marmoricola sp.]
MDPIATFKELCLDTHPTGDVPVDALSRFWAAATGCEQKFFAGSPEGADRPSDPTDPGDVVGTEEGMGIAVCPVPEPRTVKHRVHLDVHTDSVETLLALGATVLRPQDEEIRWTVLADPEGGELCAFVRAPERLGTYLAYELVVDAVDAHAIGAWWADVFGVELRTTPDEPWVWLQDVPGMAMEAWVFGNVPEPKTVKNRWHWDLYGEVDDFLARGATLLWEMPRWTVLADPEGNEFCVFPPR